MRILWIGKRPTDRQDGAEIFDRKTILACRAQGHTIDLFHPRRVGRLQDVYNLVRGVPYYRNHFASRENSESVRSRVDAYDVVICSWEPLDWLARNLTRPVILVLHNVTSRSLPALFPANPIVALAAYRARSWERKLYRQDSINAVAVLSNRDRAYVESLRGGRTVLYVPPGMPPVARLAPQAALRQEIVISGTFDWIPKRRDAIRFARDYTTIKDRRPIFATTLPKEARDALSMPSLTSHFDTTDSIRFGLITDRFEAGHKLKTLSYIANNQIVLSFSDVSFDFENVHDHQLFIRRVRSVKELHDHMLSVAAVPAADLRERFSRFKESCSKIYTWDLVASRLMNTARSIVP